MNRVDARAVSGKRANIERRRFSQAGAAATLALFGLLFAPGARAAQLRVEPVMLEITAPGAAGTLTLRNEEDVEVSVQTRVYRWSQTGGQDSLDASTDVVASPPIVTLKPRSDYTVRVVRLAKQPPQGEEAYRVLVDQLPQPQKQAARAINLLVRHSIPVFFRARSLSPASVIWSVERQGDRLFVTARNDGDERLRISSLQLRNAAGQSVNFGGGLLGYVLGHSSMSWAAPPHARGFNASGDLAVAAQSDKGPVNAVVAKTPAR